MPTPMSMKRNAKEWMHRADIRALYRRTYEVWRKADTEGIGHEHRMAASDPDFDTFFVASVPRHHAALDLMIESGGARPGEFIVGHDVERGTFISTNERLFIVHGRPSQATSLWWRDVESATYEHCGSSISVVFKMRNGDKVALAARMVPAEAIVQVLIRKGGEWNIGWSELGVDPAGKESMEPLHPKRDAFWRYGFPLMLIVLALFVFVCCRSIRRQNEFSAYTKVWMREYNGAAQKKSGITSGVHHGGAVIIDAVDLDEDGAPLVHLDFLVTVRIPDGLLAKKPQDVRTIVIQRAIFRTVNRYEGGLSISRTRHDDPVLAQFSRDGYLPAFQEDAEITVLDRRAGTVIARTVLDGGSPPPEVHSLMHSTGALYFVDATPGHPGRLVHDQSRDRYGIAGDPPTEQEIIDYLVSVWD